MASLRSARQRSRFRWPKRRAARAARTPPGRYTPPIPRNVKRSPKWVPVVILVLLLGGVADIIVNYLGLIPGGASNWYLFLGLGLISAGFLVATTYR